MPPETPYVVTEATMAEIWKLLRELDTKVTLHIEEEKVVRPKLVELLQLLDRSKGALTLIKWAAATVVAIAGAYTFLVSHFTPKGLQYGSAYNRFKFDQVCP